MFKFEVERESLAFWFARCAAVVAKHSSLDVITKVRLDYKEEALSMAGTDIEITLRVIMRLPGKGTGEGSVMINPKAFGDYLKAAKGDTVSLELTDNNSLVAMSGGFRTTFLGTPADNFPLIEEAEDLRCNGIDVDQLRDAINKTVYSVTSSDETYNLKGIRFIREPDGEGGEILRLASTDAQRLNVASIYEGDFSFFPAEGGVLVSKRGVQELLRFCEQERLRFRDYDTVYVGINNNKLIAKTGESVLFVTLLSGGFPDYRAIIPADLDKSATINRKELLAAIRRVNVLTDGDYNLAKFRFAGKKLNITIDNPNLGSAEDELGIDYAGPVHEAKFNARFLIETLSAMKSPEVTMAFADGNPSYTMEGEEDVGYQGVIVGIGEESHADAAAAAG
jgi:DNA polymerase-3 subunit beta